MTDNVAPFMKQKQPYRHAVLVVHSCVPHSGDIVLLVVPGFRNQVPTKLPVSVPEVTSAAEGQPEGYMNGGLGGGLGGIGLGGDGGTGGGGVGYPPGGAGGCGGAGGGEGGGRDPSVQLMVVLPEETSPQVSVVMPLSATVVPLA